MPFRLSFQVQARLCGLDQSRHLRVSGCSIAQGIVGGRSAQLKPLKGLRLPNDASVLDGGSITENVTEKGPSSVIGQTG
jgi:hypothetical protein